MTERNIIDMIAGLVDIRPGPDIVKGIGDDCAVLKKDQEYSWLVSVDTLVEGVHFDHEWHAWKLVGRKAASVNISDIAAMGGTPRFALISIALAHGTAPAIMDDFMAGFISVLQDHAVILVGGDTVRSLGGIVVSVTIIGEAKTDRILYRSAAHPDDTIWVSGQLGNAAAGLELCRRNLAEAQQWQECVRSHLDPEAQVSLGLLLSRSGLVHAAMDISDGLATDLAHVCAASGLAAEVYSSRLPLSENMLAAADLLKKAEADFSLRGGEDYQLLFTAAPENDEKLKELVREKLNREIFKIGKMIPGQGVFLCSGPGAPQDGRIEITFGGYDHFICA